MIDFAVQYKGESLRTAIDTWMQKAASKTVPITDFTSSSPTYLTRSSGKPQRWTRA